jgi:hypothetical protein
MRTTMFAAALAGLLAASGTAMAQAPRDVAPEGTAAAAALGAGGLSAMPPAWRERPAQAEHRGDGRARLLAGLGEGQSARWVRP